MSSGSSVSAPGEVRLRPYEAMFLVFNKEAKKSHEAFASSATAARATLIKRIHAFAPQALINEGKEQAPHILNISLPDVDTDYLVAVLDAAGIAVSTKSACETDETGSRVVLAMTGDTEQAKTTLRISWGPSTTNGEFERFARELETALAWLSKTGRK